MKTKVRKIKKISLLIRKANVPKWLHHFGPKKYELLDHLFALLVKQECKMGFRRVQNFLRDLGFVVAEYSTLCKAKKRIPLKIWTLLLQASITAKPYIVAIDGSGMSRPLPSPHYYRRIDKPYPVEIPLKLSIAVDTKTKQILALRLRAKSVHDIRDFKYLVNKLPYKPRKIVADKGYDAEWVHQFCKSKGIFAVIPIRKYGKGKHKNYSLRRLSQTMWTQKTYGRREMAESVFSAIKRKYGASVSSVICRQMLSEMHLRAIAHNISALLLGLFQRCPFLRKIYK